MSYSISNRPALSMVTEMLDKAFTKIPDETNLILHSNQGWQYQDKLGKAKGLAACDSQTTSSLSCVI